jgi:hypothetical protein
MIPAFGIWGWRFKKLLIRCVFEGLHSYRVRGRGHIVIPVDDDDS